MPDILIVDDSPIDQRRAAKLFECDDQWTIRYADDGVQALKRLKERLPDVVLTDLQMPKKNGLELVQAVRESHPGIPVVLMTARGSEEIASQALRDGAASYVSKAHLAEHLRDTVQRMVAAARADRSQSRLMHSLASGEVTFVLENDVELIDPLVELLQQMLRCMPLEDEAERLRAGIALKCAVRNAHFFGNLEIDPTCEAARRDQMEAMAADVCHAEPYRSRNVVVRANVSPRLARFEVQHEGPGFPPSLLPMSEAFQESDDALVRSLILIRSAMDEVTCSGGGRSLAFVKKARFFGEEERGSLEIEFSQ